jgi:hypothetical protein
MHGGALDDDDDDDVHFGLARTSKLLMECNYDEVVYTNPSCYGDLAICG